MAARSYFSEKFWNGQVIDFQEYDGDGSLVDSKRWQIKKQLDEQHHLGGEGDWKYFSKQRPNVAIGLFECFNNSDPSKTAFMKIHMIPYAGSESEPPSDRAEQKLPLAKVNEEFALVTMTEAGCASSPPLLNHKRVIQGSASPHVPGGFMVYLVTGALPGVILDEGAYWKLSYDKRTQIRLAFKTAYQDCFNCGIVHNWGFWGTNLLWDDATQKIFILGFRNSQSATAADDWDDKMWVSWGFCQLVEGNVPDQLPSNMLRADDAIWKF